MWQGFRGEHWAGIKQGLRRWRSIGFGFNNEVVKGSLTVDSCPANKLQQCEIFYIQSKNIEQYLRRHCTPYIGGLLRVSNLECDLRVSTT